MKRSVSLLAIVLVATTASALSAVAFAAELAGATLPDTLKVGDKTLKLNGLGLRMKAVFKVYVGGLYLESPSKDAGAVWGACSLTGRFCPVHDWPVSYSPPRAFGVPVQVEDVIQARGGCRVARFRCDATLKPS